jgi:hypothetical protein
MEAIPQPDPCFRVSGARVRHPAVVLMGIVISSCASSSLPVLAPTVDAARVALRLESATRVEGPARILFSWSLSDRDARFQGRGVARVEPPFKARIDLFSGNGETIARAALVDDDLRLPRGTPDGIIPPAELLWGTLGVFRPGAETTLLGAENLGEGRVRLRYQRPDGLVVRYTVRGDGVEEVERIRQGQTVERVTLEQEPADHYPTEATYRNLAAFRELRMSRDSAAPVEPYPPDIWLLLP